MSGANLANIGSAIAIATTTYTSLVWRPTQLSHTLLALGVVALGAVVLFIGLFKIGAGA